MPLSSCHVSSCRRCLAMPPLAVGMPCLAMPPIALPACPRATTPRSHLAMPPLAASPCLHCAALCRCNPPPCTALCAAVVPTVPPLVDVTLLLVPPTMPPLVVAILPCCSLLSLGHPSLCHPLPCCPSSCRPSLCRPRCATPCCVTPCRHCATLRRCNPPPCFALCAAVMQALPPLVDATLLLVTPLAIVIALCRSLCCCPNPCRAACRRAAPACCAVPCHCCAALCLAAPC